jgi:plasmid stabilization system protein ParE
MRIIIGRRARGDIDKLKKYLKRWDFNVEKTVSALINKIDILENFPEIGVVDRGEIRKIVVLKKNVVFYKIVGDEVWILHIRTGRAN